MLLKTHTTDEIKGPMKIGDEVCCIAAKYFSERSDRQRWAVFDLKKLQSGEPEPKRLKSTPEKEDAKTSTPVADWKKEDISWKSASYEFSLITNKDAEVHRALERVHTGTMTSEEKKAFADSERARKYNERKDKEDAEERERILKEKQEKEEAARTASNGERAREKANKAKEEVEEQQRVLKEKQEKEWQDRKKMEAAQKQDQIERERKKADRDKEEAEQQVRDKEKEKAACTEAELQEARDKLKKLGIEKQDGEREHKAALQKVKDDHQAALSKLAIEEEAKRQVEEEKLKNPPGTTPPRIEELIRRVNTKRNHVKNRYIHDIIIIRSHPS